MSDPHGVIVVDVGDPIVVLTPADVVVVNAGVGPQGPPGPPGPAGAPSSFYEHVQASPAGTWTVVHGITRRVHVTVMSVEGDVVFADVDQSLPGTAVVTFSSPAAGSAFVS